MQNVTAVNNSYHDISGRSECGECGMPSHLQSRQGYRFTRSGESSTNQISETHMCGANTKYLKLSVIITHYSLKAPKPTLKFRRAHNPLRTK